MRKGFSLALTTALLLTVTSCGRSAGSEIDEYVNRIRTRYLEMDGCSGHVEMRADYGRRIYTYGVDFTWSGEGTVLVLTSPENVAGTVAHAKAGEGALEYDGVMMATGSLDGQGLTPMDVLPALLERVRSGYLAEAALEEWNGGTCLVVACREPDSNPGTGVEAELRFAPDTDNLLSAEVSEDGYTVMYCDFTEFAFKESKED